MSAASVSAVAIPSIGGLVPWPRWSTRDHAPAAIREGGGDPPPGPPPAGDAMDQDGDRRGSAGIGPGREPFVCREHRRVGHDPILAEVAT